METPRWQGTDISDQHAESPWGLPAATWVSLEGIGSGAVETWDVALANPLTEGLLEMIR